ncbi:MAG TPA: hypothetical protein DEP84_22595 [Chloroflexi bacterium]|nr:hypothetical protein [Chloroflexota bacterium]
MATEQGIGLKDLLAIQGGGEGGRVRKRDVEQYLRTRGLVAPNPPRPHLPRPGRSNGARPQRRSSDRGPPDADACGHRRAHDSQQADLGARHCSP